MAEKRCLSFHDVSDVTGTSPNAKVQGVLTRLSPMKKTSTRSYFDGELSDGNATVRLFGFDTGVRRRLLDFEERKQAVGLSFHHNFTNSLYISNINFYYYSIYLFLLQFVYIRMFPMLWTIIILNLILCARQYPAYTYT